MCVPANGVRALRALDLDAATVQRAMTIPRQRVLDQRGHVLFDVDLRELWGDRDKCVALPRAVLHEVQGAALAFEDALALASTLSSQPSIEQAVGAFVAQRHTRTTWVRDQTHKRDRLRGLPNPIRDVALRLVGKRTFLANYRPQVRPSELEQPALA